MSVRRTKSAAACSICNGWMIAHTCVGMLRSCPAGRCIIDVGLELGRHVLAFHPGALLDESELHQRRLESKYAARGALN